MRPKPKAVLFDLDDTLISFTGVSEQAWETCCAQFLQTHSLDITNKELLSALNQARKWFWGDPQRHKTGRENMRNARREVVRLALRTFGITEEAIIFGLADTYAAYHHSLVHAFPNTLPVLSALRHRGYRLGLITNGTSVGQREKLDRFGLVPYFEIILIDLEVGFSKPDIRIYEYAKTVLGLQYQDLWMVGDNLVWDIQSPKSLGIYTVWCDFQSDTPPADTAVSPDAVIQDIAELLTLLP